MDQHTEFMPLALDPGTGLHQAWIPLSIAPMAIPLPLLRKVALMDLSGELYAGGYANGVGWLSETIKLNPSTLSWESITDYSVYGLDATYGAYTEVPFQYLYPCQDLDSTVSYD